MQILWATQSSDLLCEAADLEVVGIATSAAEAEELVREVRPDLVLMDVRVPGVDGIEATRRVRAASPGARRTATWPNGST